MKCPNTSPEASRQSSPSHPHSVSRARPSPIISMPSWRPESSNPFHPKRYATRSTTNAWKRSGAISSLPRRNNDRDPPVWHWGAIPQVNSFWHQRQLPPPLNGWKPPLTGGVFPSTIGFFCVLCTSTLMGSGCFRENSRKRRYRASNVRTVHFREMVDLQALFGCSG